MEKFIHAIEEKNQGFMAHSLCPYYTTYHPLNVDFIGFSALLYDKIRGFCLGLCRQSDHTSVKRVWFFSVTISYRYQRHCIKMMKIFFDLPSFLQNKHIINLRVVYMNPVMVRRDRIMSSMRDIGWFIPP